MKMLPTFSRPLGFRRSCLVAGVLASLPATVMAQAPWPATAAPPLTVTPVQPAAPPLRPAPPISEPDLVAMADLFRAPPTEVMQRLAWDPALAPLAVQAVRSGQFRRRGGTSLMIVGLITAAVGLMFWAQGDSHHDSTNCEADPNDCESWNFDLDFSSEFHSLGFPLVAMGVTLAIPGLALLATTTASEDEALRRYRQTEPVRPSPPRPLATGPSSGSPAKTFQVQLLSLRF